ncbi:hypothetical protein BCCGELA001_29470 [Bradyrhizobium sp. CCGE-LA001]|nr:hypothetical protein BCCGELA001_29470 [Bradyrhizobium sp. CCGE-LA001]
MARTIIGYRQGSGADRFASPGGGRCIANRHRFIAQIASPFQRIHFSYDQRDLCSFYRMPQSLGSECSGRDHQFKKAARLSDDQPTLRRFLARLFATAAEAATVGLYAP